ncbi:hypothetical protein [Mycolicibacterium gilvum]|uniref:hypothetical protein n=1 Tax=Mycolicibacterium gilvum TaxID=1804 RepID=UPI0040466A93
MDKRWTEKLGRGHDNWGYTASEHAVSEVSKSFRISKRAPYPKDFGGLPPGRSTPRVQIVDRCPYDAPFLAQVDHYGNRFGGIDLAEIGQ